MSYLGDLGYLHSLRHHYSVEYILPMAEKGRWLPELSCSKNRLRALLAMHFEYSDQQFSLEQ